MLSNRFLLGMVAAASLMTSSASALELRSDVVLGATLIAGGSSAGGTFNLAGFNSTGQQVDSAVAYFNFLDTLGVQTTVAFTLGASGFVPDNSTVLGPFVTVGGNVGALALADLQDGAINFDVSAPALGTITLLGASLVAQVSAKSIGVPDTGTTIGLMGMALIGLASISVLRQKLA